MSDDRDPDADVGDDTATVAESTPDETPDQAMTADTASDATERNDTDGEPTDDEPADTGSARESRDLVRYARYALLGGLTLLALVATLRFYFAASNAIDLWVAREYRPLFQAAFNLVVLLLAAVGISWEIRQVTA